MRALSQKHDICRTLIPIWIDKYQRGEFDDDAIEEELLHEYTTRIAQSTASDFGAFRVLFDGHGRSALSRDTCNPLKYR